MSERDYLISKAERNLDEMREVRRRTFTDPAYGAAAASGIGGTGAMLHGLHKKGADIVRAEGAARAEGKKGWQAVKPALKVVPKRYWAGAGAALTGTAAMQGIPRKHIRDVRAGR